MSLVTSVEVNDYYLLKKMQTEYGQLVLVIYIILCVWFCIEVKDVLP